MSPNAQVAIAVGVIILLFIQSYLLWIQPDVAALLPDRAAAEPTVDPTATAQALVALTATAAALTPPGLQTGSTAVATAPALITTPGTPNTGEVVQLTDQQANAYFAANPDALAPLDQVSVRFLAGQVQTDVRAFGISARVLSGLTVENGRVRLVNPRLDGAPDFLISVDEVAQPIERQINAQLVNQNQRIRAVRIDPGVLNVTLEPEQMR
jgi:hypothetical protein